MSTFVITAPTSTPFIAADLRASLNLGATTPSDIVLTSLINAATGSIDGPEGWLGRAICTQTLERRAHAFPSWCHDEWDGGYCGRRNVIKLLCPPVASIVSVKYLDTTGADQTLDPATYILDDRELTPVYGTEWPACRAQPSSVRVRYTAGYSDGSVPPQIIQAITLACSNMLAMNRPDPLLKQDTVIGITSLQWETQVDVAAIYDRVAGSLLSTLRVF